MDLENLPLFKNKDYDSASIFTPQSLIENAKRQKNIKEANIPKVCILDPDGDLLEFLQKRKEANLNESWPCYHTELYNFHFGGYEFGVIANVVGSSYAVLVAEELYTLGCEVIFHLTSAGKVDSSYERTKFMVIERSLRDEGTSYHYLPPSEYTYIKEDLRELLSDYCNWTRHLVNMGTSWTTDAPFRETKEAIESAKDKGVVTVEMESSALYALSQYRKKNMICIAHLTNEMGQVEEDFEKGFEGGSQEALEIMKEILDYCK